VRPRPAILLSLRKALDAAQGAAKCQPWSWRHPKEFGGLKGCSHCRGVATFDHRPTDEELRPHMQPCRNLLEHQSLRYDIRVDYAQEASENLAKNIIRALDGGNVPAARKLLEPLRANEAEFSTPGAWASFADQVEGVIGKIPAKEVEDATPLPLPRLHDPDPPAVPTMPSALEALPAEAPGGGVPDVPAGPGAGQEALDGVPAGGAGGDPGGGGEGGVAAYKLRRAVRGRRPVLSEVVNDRPYPTKETPMSDYQVLGARIGALVDTKQAAYGDSFGKAGAILRILYPQGIPLEKVDDVLTVARVVDKLFRIATDRDALGESPWGDIAGYALLALRRVEEGRGAPKAEAKAQAKEKKRPVAVAARKAKATHDELVARIRAAVCKAFEITQEQLDDRKTTNGHALQRAVAYYLHHELTGATYGRIAKAWGRAQSVVCAGPKRLAGEMDRDPDLKAKVRGLLDELVA
jgi:hypothetical protein